MADKRNTYAHDLLYYELWDTEDYGYVHIYDDGRLIRTNNYNKSDLILTKKQFKKFMEHKYG